MAQMWSCGLDAERPHAANSGIWFHTRLEVSHSLQSQSFNLGLEGFLENTNVSQRQKAAATLNHETVGKQSPRYGTITSAFNRSPDSLSRRSS